MKILKYQATQNQTFPSIDNAIGQRIVTIGSIDGYVYISISDDLDDRSFLPVGESEKEGLIAKFLESNSHKYAYELGLLKRQDYENYLAGILQSKSIDKIHQNIPLDEQIRSICIGLNAVYGLVENIYESTNLDIPAEQKATLDSLRSGFSKLSEIRDVLLKDELLRIEGLSESELIEYDPHNLDW